MLETQDLKEALDHKDQQEALDLQEVQDQKDQQEYLLDHNTSIGQKQPLVKHPKVT